MVQEDSWIVDGTGGQLDINIAWIGEGTGGQLDS